LSDEIKFDKSSVISTMLIIMIVIIIITVKVIMTIIIIIIIISAIRIDPKLCKYIYVTSKSESKILITNKNHANRFTSVH